MNLNRVSHRTSGCRRFSHPEISISVDRRAPDVDWLINSFETEVAKGRVFRAGETVQIGWGLVLLCKDVDVDEDLEVWEPDFTSMPIQWRRGANETVRQLTIQRMVVEASGCEPKFPSLLEACSLDPNCNAADEFVMWRSEPQQKHSGWFLAEGLGDEVTQLCSLYELSCKIPDVTAFFALPAGCEVRVSRKRIAIRCAERCVSSDENEFLRRLLTRASRPGHAGQGDGL